MNVYEVNRGNGAGILNRADGWMNILAGLGIRSDKTQRNFFGSYEILDDKELTRLWLGEGLGKKIVSSVADDMTRNWINIEGDSENVIMKELIKLGAETKVNESLKWARLYRGSIIVLGINDGRKLEEPLAPKGVKSIDWLKVYSAPRIIITSGDIVTDPKSPYFEDIEIYNIQKINGEIIKVHHSRCLIFRGDPVPQTQTGIDLKNLYWGTSILQAIWERLKNFGSAEQSIANLLMEAVVGKYKLSNLAQILSEGNTEAIYNRMEIINASKSIINGVLLDKDEDYTRDSANMTSIPAILDRFMMTLSAVSEIPVTRLFGRSPAGQNATGESDLRTYYDMVSSKQKTWMLPPLQVLVNLINAYTGTVKGEDAFPIVTPNPVWEPTQAELIEMKKKQAETDKQYIETGVLGAEEVRENRFENGYSFNTTVEGEVEGKTE